ncbi:hypothetical protein F7O84_17785 [Candidatus Galacturonibacter soehngenii]|uniref:Glycosyltransferase RgtA/B/C/D-like domain-containing protein n=2 Tax=Candidatus Galacturonatibacter soehngenii TaxID=2307010 RepID=A0A7V7QHD9_9FIRM|nr:hypothetical protein F7O84_17785 [Candidatus Galacturonibacter soehngenii]
MFFTRINHLLYCLFLAMLSFFISCILLMALNLNNTEFFSTFLFGYKVPAFIIICASFIFLLLNLIYRLLCRYELSKNIYLPYILLLAIFIFQAIFILKMKVSLRYDTLKVFDQAIALLNGQSLSPDYSLGYFAKYPNNIPICITTALILKLPKLLGLPTNFFMLYVQLVNALMMCISYYFSYRLLCRVKNPKVGVMFLLLVLFHPLTYLIAPFYYTHTISMPFSSGAIYFFICCIQEKESVKKRLIYSFLTGFIIIIGFKIRATVMIVAIAMFIYLLLNLKMLTRKSLVTVIAFICSVIIGFSSYSIIEKQYVHFNYKDTGYPITHWIMLGLQGTGGYNAADDNFTESFTTKDLRVKATEAVIVQRVKTLRVPGLLRLWRDKLEITWSDSTDDFIDNLSMTQNYSSINDYISGSNNDILVSFCHIYYFVILGFMFISILYALFQQPKNLLFPVMLNFLGGILFHILWEAGEVYSISFTCSMLILAADGFHICFDKINTIRKQKIYIAFGAISTCLTLFSLIYIGNKMIHVPYTHYNYAAKQDLAEPDNPFPLLSDTLCQTFTTNRTFNTIGVKVRNTLGNENCSSYKFRLLNDNDKILYETSILGRLAFDKDYYRIEVGTIIPNKTEEFKIQIIPDLVSDVHCLTFQSYETGNYDIYPNGVLYKNDSPTLGDLTFIVFHKNESTFW